VTNLKTAKALGCAAAYVAYGTKRTCRQSLLMSAFEGNLDARRIYLVRLSRDLTA